MNIPDAQRGERGEMLAVRVQRGTKELLDALARKKGLTKGEIVEIALAKLSE